MLRQLLQATPRLRSGCYFYTQAITALVYNILLASNLPSNHHAGSMPSGRALTALGALQLTREP